MKTTTDSKTGVVTTEMSPAERTKLAGSADILRKFSWYTSGGKPALEGSLAELATAGKDALRKLLAATAPKEQAPKEPEPATADKAKKAKETETK